MTTPRFSHAIGIVDFKDNDPVPWRVVYAEEPQTVVAAFLVFGDAVRRAGEISRTVVFSIDAVNELRKKQAMLNQHGHILVIPIAQQLPK